MKLMGYGLWDFYGIGDKLLIPDTHTIGEYGWIKFNGSMSSMII